MFRPEGWTPCGLTGNAWQITPKSSALVVTSPVELSHYSGTFDLTVCSGDLQHQSKRRKIELSIEDKRFLKNFQERVGSRRKAASRQTVQFNFDFT